MYILIDGIPPVLLLFPPRPLPAVIPVVVVHGAARLRIPRNPFKMETGIGNPNKANPPGKRIYPALSEIP